VERKESWTKAYQECGIERGINDEWSRRKAISCGTKGNTQRKEGEKKKIIRTTARKGGSIIVAGKRVNLMESGRAQARLFITREESVLEKSPNGGQQVYQVPATPINRRETRVACWIPGSESKVGDSEPRKEKGNEHRGREIGSQPSQQKNGEKRA